MPDAALFFFFDHPGKIREESADLLLALTIKGKSQVQILNQSLSFWCNMYIYCYKIHCPKEEM